MFHLRSTNCAANTEKTQYSVDVAYSSATPMNGYDDSLDTVTEQTAYVSWNTGPWLADNQSRVNKITAFTFVPLNKPEGDIIPTDI